MQAPHPQRGLTLVEAAVVVAIVATAATAAAPGLGRLIDHRRLEAAATPARRRPAARPQRGHRPQPRRAGELRRLPANCYVVHTGAADQCSCAADGSGQCTAGADAAAQRGLDRGRPLRRAVEQRLDRLRPAARHQHADRHLARRRRRRPRHPPRRQRHGPRAHLLAARRRARLPRLLKGDRHATPFHPPAAARAASR